MLVPFAKIGSTDGAAGEEEGDVGGEKSRIQKPALSTEADHSQPHGEGDSVYPKYRLKH